MRRSYQGFGVLLLGLVGVSAVAQAQAPLPPDVGDILQERREAPEMPQARAPLEIQTPVLQPVEPGGPSVRLQAIELTGNSVFTAETLLSELGEIAGMEVDLAGLRALADQLMAFYQRQGYLFATVFLPAQTADEGRVRMDIIEGQFGVVEASGDDARLVAGTNQRLSVLTPGDVITSNALERTTLLLEDLPGLAIEPIIRPGEQFGTGDLQINVLLEQPYGFELGLDNHGNRYTGYHRARFDAQANSLIEFGDQLSLRTLYSEEDLLLGSLTYTRPLGRDGLRLTASHAYTSYELGRDFNELGLEGRAEITNLGLSYPLIRSEALNLTLASSLQYKDLEDRAPDRDDNKTSRSIPVSLSFDRRDRLGGGGLWFGSLSATPGEIRLSQAQRAEDVLGIHGSYTAFNLDLIRVQALPIDALSLYARYSSQWADSNLDSSESFSLAGPTGVRAYPVGEVSGDEGWLTQAELRYRYGMFAPYVFYDIGSVTSQPSTTLAGAGIGTRVSYQRLTLDAGAAWRTRGDRPADLNESDQRPRLWFSATLTF